jgi:hypothetical protein
MDVWMDPAESLPISATSAAPVALFGRPAILRFHVCVV